jgi:type II secretory pathway pseudopilin PulG
VRTQRFRRRSSRGFTYLGVLFFVAALGIGLAAAGTVWQTQVRRDKEAELLFVGEQFQIALRDWNRANANVGDGFPKTLEQLLSDPNTPTTRRFLRRIYVDPMTGKADWGLVKSAAGSIRGVYSLSTDKPFRQQLPESLGEIESAASYSDWKFMVTPGAREATQVAAAGPTAPGLPSAPLPAFDPSGEPVVTPAPRPPPVDPKVRRCNQISQVDAGACAALERRYGPRASVPCLASAREREEACRTDSAIPPLVTNQR